MYNLQLGLDTAEAMQHLPFERLIVWIGDQLTTERVRGLQRLHRHDYNMWERFEHILALFGWLHAQMAEEQSIHAQYYLTSAGMGLKQAFDLLDRKGLHSPSVAGTFHQKLEEALKHVAEAHFRDLWRIVGGVEDLGDLRTKTPEELKQIANKILDEYASTSAVQAQTTLGDKKDPVFLNSILFCRDILNYLDLDDAMHTGDVGRIRDLLPRLLFRYHGGSNPNYTREILELLQGLNREWPEDLW